MRLQRLVSVLIVGIMCIGSVSAQADGKKQKHKVDRKAWNPYACCHDMNSIQNTPVLITDHYLAPEFYFADTVHTGDTAWAFECYGLRNNLLNMDTVMDFQQVKYLSLYKKYTDPEHFYKDDKGQRQPLPVAFISKRYDRLGSDKWMSISYPGNKFTQLKEYTTTIVRTDSFMEEGATKNEMIMSVYEYYKVGMVK